MISLIIRKIAETNYLTPKIMDENKINEKVEEIKEEVKEALVTPDTTASFDPEDINKNKIFAILAYFGILVLVPIFAAKDSKFAKFHANQGLLLFIAEIAGSVISVIPVLGTLVSFVVSIACFALAIIGIINAAKGEAKELPVIGKYEILK